MKAKSLEAALQLRQNDRLFNQIKHGGLFTTSFYRVVNESSSNEASRSISRLKRLGVISSHPLYKDGNRTFYYHRLTKAAASALELPSSLAGELTPIWRLRRGIAVQSFCMEECFASVERLA